MRQLRHVGIGSIGIAAVVVAAACGGTSSIVRDTPAAPAAAVLDLRDEAAGLGATFDQGSYGPRAVPEPVGAVTPEQYGAKGDGTSDDTRAVQAALNAGAGKTVWLAADHTYVINTSLDVSSGTTVLGAGTTAVLKFTWFDLSQSNSGKGAYISNRAMVGTPRDRDITYSNFVIDGAGTGKPSGTSQQNPDKLAPSLRADDTDGWTMDHMEIRNSPGLSVSYHNLSGVRIHDNFVHNSGRDGITGFWQRVGDDVDVEVTHNLIAHVGDDGIAINGLPEGTRNDVGLPSGILVADNFVLGWPGDPNGRALGRGIAIIGVAGAMVTRNHIANTNEHSAAIMLFGCSQTFCQTGSVDPATGKPWLSQDVRISANIIRGAGTTPSENPGNIGSAIYLRTAHNSEVSDNRIIDTNPAYPDIDSAGCASCTIARNSIEHGTSGNDGSDGGSDGSTATIVGDASTGTSTTSGTTGRDEGDGVRSTLVAATTRLRIAAVTPRSGSTMHSATTTLRVRTSSSAGIRRVTARIGHGQAHLLRLRHGRYELLVRRAALRRETTTITITVTDRAGHSRTQALWLRRR